MTADQIKTLLNLQPLPVEGGYYAKTYRADESIPAPALPGRYSGDRRFGGAIYYLLTADTCSALHRLVSDEVYHFYLGDPVEILQLLPDGSGRLITLGPNLENGMRLQAVVPRGVWQGSRLITGGQWALMGTTMAPDYEDADYEHGDRETLIAIYPQFAELIATLT